MEQILNNRFPFTPFPIGWYWVEFSENLKRGQLRSKTWMGQQTVFWRDEQDQPCLANAICPHLGANLSPEFGGKIQEGQLICPFFGLKYNTEGQCVYSPLGEIKRPVTLKTYPVVETGGVIFAYWHPDSEEPKWSLPDLTSGNWSKFRHTSQKIRTHPQETSENGVDLTHLPYVHGYSNVESLGPLHIEGHQLRNRFKLTRLIGPSKRFCLRLNVQSTVTMLGVGFSMIESTMETAGLHIRQLALSTPIDGEKVNFVMAIQMQDIKRPNVLVPGLSLLPKRLLNAILLKIFFKVYLNDISQDWDIWENKEYLTSPRLDASETSILHFRRYCEQFNAPLE